MGRCTACSACKTSKQVVFGDGDMKAAIVSIGEAPGPEEDKSGRPFDGPAGKLYDKFLEEAAIKREDIWTSNTIKCFPGRDAQKKIQKPSDEQVQTCTKEFLFDELKIIKPRVILVWGLTAAQALLKTTLSMKELIGKELETDWGIVIPLYHPSYFLHNQHDFTARRLVLDALGRAKFLTGSTTGTYVDQVKTERHQEDKTVIAELEEKSGVFQHNPWNEKREYTTAWSEGTSVVLVYKNKHGEKSFEKVDDFDWYFYMKTKDVIKLGDTFWAPWLRNGVVHGFKVDDVNAEWTQVFAYRHVVRTAALREHLLESYLTLWGDLETLKQKFKEDVQLRLLLDAIDLEHEEGYISGPHFEADLTPARRFMTDYDIKIMSAYDEMYVDIETDDTKPLVDRKTISERRILSIAWEMIYADKSRKSTTGYIQLKKETNRAEAEMLEEFAGEMEGSGDIMYAWNGNNFDFPILRNRMRMYRVTSRWDLIHTIDLLRTYIRYHQRGASANTSFALQAIAQHALKTNKVDWKQMAAEQKIMGDDGQPIKKMLQLYRHAPHILEEYNRWDAHLLVELEKLHGYAKVDQVFSRIGNCFARDYHITTKIDSLLLKRGKQAGVHFPTKKIKIMTEGGKDAYKKKKYGHEGAIYEGAYVLDPHPGLFEDVAAMDFKSLYPSVMLAFNISPETWIRPEDVETVPRKDRIQAPDTKAWFRTDVRGFVPGIFKDTGEKRKVYQKLQAEQPVGSDLFLLYYRLAYSFKRLGLSFYGDMGNVESRYFEPSVAESVTKAGQWVLKRTKEYLEELGYIPLYGDTDSIYFQLPAEQGQAVADKVNAYLKAKMKRDFGVPDERFAVELEYENYFKRMFFVRKKRYAGLMTMYKGKEASFNEIKGLECMRSDGIEYARQMQRTVIDMIIREQRRPREIVQFLMDEREKALEGKHAMDDITITKAMTKAMDSYKSELVHVSVARKMRDRGDEVYVGMKVPYIVTGNKPKLQAIPADEYKGEYDARYYWDKLMLPPCYRIVNAVYPGVSWYMLFADEKLQTPAKAAKATNIESTNGNGHGKDDEDETPDE